MRNLCGTLIEPLKLTEHYYMFCRNPVEEHQHKVIICKHDICKFWFMLKSKNTSHPKTHKKKFFSLLN